MPVTDVPAKETIEKLFRHKILRMLHDEGAKTSRATRLRLCEATAGRPLPPQATLLPTTSF